MLEEPVCVRKKKGKRLLDVSRRVLERVLSCSCAYLLTGEREYAERAEAEIKMEVKEGDQVLYGKYAGTEISFEGTSYLILKQSEILAVIE